MRAFLLASLVLLTGCQAEEPNVSDASADGIHKLTAEEIAACDRALGEVVISGFGLQTCLVPTIDAGEACTSEHSCESLCLAETRQCAPVTPYFGCHDILIDGDETATICID
ncbi:hypothetical protein [Cochlodiniinecator piscidefendens]|uniref:hypothetical protein n=1 Tax=Cochlodiniinecator piscidefendens TaxID=2715756 RepID=UPI00140A4634|nr:hypothetical protein [Cochlodiniinecator piscidefendens]